MKVVIVYESFFGNTEKIAKAMSNNSDAKAEIQVLNVQEIAWKNIPDFDVLIVGSPTRGFRPCKETTRFLKEIPAKGLKNKNVAAFDTRMSLPEIESKALRFIVKTGGYAAKHIAKSLVKNGGRLVLPPEGFLVSGEEGPLNEGEILRAEKWVNGLIS